MSEDTPRYSSPAAGEVLNPPACGICGSPVRHSWDGKVWTQGCIAYLRVFAPEAERCDTLAYDPQLHCILAAGHTGAHVPPTQAAAAVPPETEEEA